ncbi:MAG: ferrous iron transport protein A [Ileibacterium sp.]|nr:ferrous iron transport protein A [Ileibacterium sp.]
MKLSEASKDCSLVVKSIDLDEQARNRLQVLGMIENTPVTILQRKGSGTIIISLRGSRFALGSGMAGCIEVDYA